MSGGVLLTSEHRDVIFEKLPSNPFLLGIKFPNSLPNPMVMSFNDIFPLSAMYLVGMSFSLE
jgi:hypothetical protein